MKKIGIVGVGKLGLCLALSLEKSGYKVKGVDLSPQYIEAINKRTFSTGEPEVVDALSSVKNFSTTANIREILDDKYELIFIVVQTTSLADGRFDHGKIDQVVRSMMDFGPRDHSTLLAIVSTTMPGYCDEIAAKVNSLNYEVIYHPEFIAQGSIMRDLREPDQVLIGAENHEVASRFEAVIRTLHLSTPSIHHMSRLSAEIAKLATNCFLTTKISFANAIGDLAIKMGAEPDKILTAVGADHRVGHSFLKYGFGYGGPCLPRDNRALQITGEDHDYDLLISKATDAVNRRHLNFMVDQYLRKYSKEDIITFHHISYKKDTDIIEESQQLALAVNLAKKGYRIRISETEPVIKQVRELYGFLFQYETR